MSADFGTRRGALRELLIQDGLDSILITDLLNVRYLTGFTGSNAALLVSTGGDERTVICTDGRYVTQVAEQVPDLRAEIDRASALHLLGAGISGRGTRVGFESHVVTVDAHRAWAQLDGGLELVRAPGVVESLRMVKDEYEVGVLRDACRAADDALAELLSGGGIRVGRTEREVARELESLMLDHGADAVSFETIVAAGVNSAVPHHRPTDAVLAEGDFVKLDFGALVAGYHSDMTRTFVIGEPAQWQRELYELVQRSQAAGREALAPGIETASVDAASRSVIEEAGYGEYFLHGLGHGVGLEIHEAPGIAKSSTGTLLSGAAVTVEPGVYFSGRGGVRIEDTLVVRDEGPELLTLTSKELTSV
ncbi:aminopeptidase P family protein [Rhodococcus fascians]|uniref:M24 family metallopeptidase n=1 Tax=Rhodococcoides fascians TaxID=1828 RepID=UPI001961C53A|nr:Xaa-Pro peptidase family protein [Rhodococcus fascians]MBM7244687.1 aminopeptidase P family protein [Rhodococcus fascians]MBY3807791.1 aminopeptidase P family protein [Rhodococcus fascians]MBY3839338.1 aminopeptidase P family protein [Rhodococcus fascians]MBY3846752.1 aminopeptidase P family protein [Rhodococcus fascians]MBY3851607.1 aminopeptidase P family protein [Rhodococcus fascians]